MIETRTIDGETFSRFSESAEFVFWAVSAGWTSGADFEASTGNAISVLLRKRRWVRSYTDERGRRRFAMHGYRAVEVLES